MPKRFVMRAVAALLIAAGPGLAAAEVQPPAAPQAEGAQVPKGEVLDIRQCLDIALKAQPAIRAARGQAAASQSRIGQAESSYYPRVDASAAYSRTKPPATANRPSSTGGALDFFSNNINLTQNIYDFGRTSSNVKIQERNTEAFRGDLENTVTVAAFNVKQAYYTLLQAIKNRAVAEETVKQFEAHLEQARGFFEVGVKPRFDVTRAEVDLSNARVNLIRADNAVRIAMIGLKNAMGTPEAPDFGIVDDLAIQPRPITLEEAQSKALASRPDLRASGARKRSAEEAVNFAKRGYYPALNGNAGYTWAGESFPGGEGWNAGVALSVPLFTGFLTKYQVQESRANLDTFSANEAIVRQAVILDVQQAYSNLKEAGERIPASDLALKQAAENLDIANGRYSAGVGSPIEVTDATVAYINAKTAYIQALSDYKIAQASLDKAMGAE